MSYICIFFHIDKTGGSYIYNTFINNGFEQISFNDLYEKRFNIPCNKYICHMHGHHVPSFYSIIDKLFELKSILNESLIIFTVFRDPVQHTVSLYNYFHQSNNIASSLRRNYQVHYLYNSSTYWEGVDSLTNNETVVTNLKTYIDSVCDIIVVTENIDILFRKLALKWKISFTLSDKKVNVSTGVKSSDLSKDDIREIENKTQFDNYLYRQYKEPYLYIGSCRYMHILRGADHFPARLHSTKEIKHYLENYLNLSTYINTLPHELVNLVFGDIFNKAVIEDSIIYLNRSCVSLYNKIVIEITSSKLFIYNQYVPCNYYYTQLSPEYIKTYNLTEMQQNEEDIESDIDSIYTLIKSLFGVHVKMCIITHFNAKTNNNIYDKRQQLINILENICNKKSIQLINPAVLMEQYYGDVDMNMYMQDGAHYNDKLVGDKIRFHLLDKLNEF